MARTQSCKKSKSKKAGNGKISTHTKPRALSQATLDCHKLSGYLLTALSSSSLKLPEEQSKTLHGAECYIVSDGQNGHVVVNGISYPISSSSSSSAEDSENSPDTVGKKRRRGAASAASSSIINHLDRLTTHNGVRVIGHVVKVVQGANSIEMVILFDVYLPCTLWFVPNLWKKGIADTAAVTHLSCDWKRRKEFLESPNQELESLMNESTGECNVLGCNLHKYTSPEKKRKYDLHEVFKCLSHHGVMEAYDDGSILPEVKIDECGLWSLPDEVVTGIFSRLTPRDLKSVAGTCRHARIIAAGIVPCMNLKLFQHQHDAVQWMLQRENRSQVYENPLYKDLETEDGFHIYFDTVSGEVLVEKPPDITDFKGGFFCDEPGLGKTITALSLILKTQGLYAKPPEGVKGKWMRNLPGSDEQRGYYDVTGTSKKRRYLPESPAKLCPFTSSKRLKLSLEEKVEVKEENFEEEEAEESQQCRIEEYGFYEVKGGTRRNVNFFESVLKDYAELLSESKIVRAITWLANLRPEQLRTMAYKGISVPQELRMTVLSKHEPQYETFFQAFGLVSEQDEKTKAVKWMHPYDFKDLHFDVKALKSVLSRPVEETRVYLSKATLVVVPPNLVEHWKTQIEKHTTKKQLRYCVCVDPKKVIVPEMLAYNYDLVITTFSRLSSEWSIRKNSLLLQVHWYRIILDEGHTLGASLSLTNKLEMAINMPANNRWVLTGTPLPDTSNQLAHLQPMLRFLHDHLYGTQKIWDNAILRPFDAYCEEGRSRLLELLQRCMISSKKLHLPNTIPACVRKVKLIEFTATHATTYNELVETVRRNILMADWNDPDHVESLLNQKNWKLRGATIRNVRLSCCVAGNIKVHNANQDIQETMDLVIEQGGGNHYAAIRNALLYGANCQRCSMWCRLPILTPCFHILCLSCVELDVTKCSLPSCGHAYKMQSPQDLKRAENPNPKWPVPQDLIELQPSYIQEDWHPEWQATSSSKVTYLIQQLKAIQSEHKAEDDLPQKIIVFSQFLEHISVVEMQLTTAGIKHAGMYSPLHKAKKMKSLKSFQEDPECLVLLMDGSSALGLDLSFVTNIYLMEPIWDRSIEEQVVSRAHRMGATRPVIVETLAMRGTIEEQMVNYLQGSVHKRHQQNDPAESGYLSHLSFVRTQQQ